MTRPTERTVALASGLAAWLAAGAYSSFVLAHALHSRLPAARSFISELEATGQPHRGFFRLSDVLSGVLVVLVAAAILRTGRLGPRARPGCALIALMGLASVTDGSTRMGCAPSLDAACAARDSTVLGLLSQVLEPHTLSGLFGFLGGAAGMVLIGLAARDSAPAWATAGVVAGTVLAAVGLADLALLFGDSVFGLTERARALVVSGWLFGAGAYLFRSAAARPRPTGVPGADAGEPRPAARAGRRPASSAGPAR